MPLSRAKKQLHDANIDSQKWESLFAYVAAYNDWRVALSRYGDSFHPEVTKLWDRLLQAQSEVHRMQKK